MPVADDSLVGEASRIERVDVDVGALQAAECFLQIVKIAAGVEVLHREPVGHAGTDQDDGLAPDRCVLERRRHGRQCPGQTVRTTAGHHAGEGRPAGHRPGIPARGCPAFRGPLAGSQRGLRRERIDGRDQLARIRGEVLRLAAQREHHGSEIVRAEPIDDGVRDLSCRLRDALVVRRHPVVHDDDDDAAQIELIGGDVGADLSHPVGGDRWGRRDVDGCERGDGLRPAVFEHREVLGAQPADRLPVSVKDGDVEPDEVDPDAEGLLRLGGWPGLRPSVSGCENDQETRHSSTHARCLPTLAVIPIRQTGTRTAIPRTANPRTRATSALT